MNLPVPADFFSRGSGPRAVAVRQTMALALVTRLAPIVRASLLAAIAGLGLELALRAAVTRSLTALGRGAVEASAHSLGATTRTIVTEYVVHERVRRVR